MAKIICPDIQKLEDQLVASVPECESEIRWFMLALSEITSLQGHQLAEFGFDSVKPEERKRLYRCTLRCAGDAVFEWKDAEVRNLTIVLRDVEV